MVVPYRVRQAAALILLFAGIVTFVAGVALFVSGGRGAGRLGLRELMKDVHTYAGFVASGAAVVHIAANWRVLLHHFKKLVS